MEILEKLICKLKLEINTYYESSLCSKLSKSSITFAFDQVGELIGKLNESSSSVGLTVNLIV